MIAKLPATHPTSTLLSVGKVPAKPQSQGVTATCPLSQPVATSQSFFRPRSGVIGLFHRVLSCFERRKRAEYVVGLDRGWIEREKTALGWIDMLLGLHLFTRSGSCFGFGVGVHCSKTKLSKSRTCKSAQLHGSEMVIYITDIKYQS